MEFRLWPLGFIEFFVKQQSLGSKENESKIGKILYHIALGSTQTH